MKIEDIVYPGFNKSLEELNSIKKIDDSFRYANNKESKINNEYPVNLNTKYDRTLMRTTAYECKNEDCPSKNKQTNPMIVSYARNNNLTQGYMCTECDACWH